jgi:hypothetical protein
VVKANSFRPLNLNDLGIVHDDLDYSEAQRLDLLLDDVQPRRWLITRLLLHGVSMFLIHDR